MNNQYTWLQFYIEFANKLRQYHNNRAKLINSIKSVFSKAEMSLPKLDNDEPTDIDPFTIFGLFNKRLKPSNRISLIKNIAKEFDINADIPNDFNGVPVLNPLHSVFYGFGNHRNDEDIDNLWEFYLRALDYADSGTNKTEFCHLFNTVIKQFCVSLSSLTMGLFWIRPYNFLNLDETNKRILKDQTLVPSNVALFFNTKVIKKKNYDPQLDAEVYLEFCNTCLAELRSSEFEYNDFPSLSYYAWEHKPSDNNNVKWDPPIDEYTPGLSTDDWLELLNNMKVFKKQGLELIKQIYDVGGQATCSELADLYGGTAMHYSGTASKLAQRIHTTTGCPLSKSSNGADALWSILFIAKKADKEQPGVWVLKLRDELVSAYEIFIKNTSINTWLLAFNPQKWNWKDYNDAINTTKQGKGYCMSWSCVNQHVKPGDKVFMVKLGDNSTPKGIFASGYITSNSRKDENYNYSKNNSISYVDVILTTILDYRNDEIITLDYLNKEFPDQSWSPQSSGIAIKPIIANKLISLWESKDFSKHVEETLPPSNSEFLKYFPPLIQALKELGGSAARKEAHEKVIEIMGISDDELNVTYEKTGASRVINQIDFARNDLAHEGLISNGTKGVWALTELGSTIDMTLELAGQIHMKWVKINTAKRKGAPIPIIDLAKHYKKKAENKYTKADFLEKVFLTEKEYDKVHSLILKKKNVILQGAPGVGKTFSAKRLAYSIIGEVNDSRICMVQFHQNYSYEDFIMGYRPTDDGGFELQSGVFYNFCIRCKENPLKPYFMIIDEINRGNLSKIFGELMMLMETDKRGEEHKLNLVYGGTSFYIPNNLYIIGMMNTADRSLAMIDYALRRRFSFYTMYPAFEDADHNGFAEYTKKIKCDLYHKTIKAVSDLNKTIREELGKGFEIGHSYFSPKDTSLINDEWVKSVVEYEIIPLIEEYWFDNDEILNEEKLKLYQVIGDSDDN